MELKLQCKTNFLLLIREKYKGLYKGQPVGSLMQNDNRRREAHMGKISRDNQRIQNESPQFQVQRNKYDHHHTSPSSSVKIQKCVD